MKNVNLRKGKKVSDKIIYKNITTGEYELFNQFNGCLDAIPAGYAWKLIKTGGYKIEIRKEGGEEMSFNENLKASSDMLRESLENEDEDTKQFFKEKERDLDLYKEARARKEVELCWANQTLLTVGGKEAGHIINKIFPKTTNTDWYKDDFFNNQKQLRIAEDLYYFPPNEEYHLSYYGHLTELENDIIFVGLAVKPEFAYELLEIAHIDYSNNIGW